MNNNGPLLFCWVVSSSSDEGPALRLISGKHASSESQPWCLMSKRLNEYFLLSSSNYSSITKCYLPPGFWKRSFQLGQHFQKRSSLLCWCWIMNDGNWRSKLKKGIYHNRTLCLPGNGLLCLVFFVQYAEHWRRCGPLRTCVPRWVFVACSWERQQEHREKLFRAHAAMWSSFNDEESMKEEELKQNIFSKKLNHEMHH